MPFTTLGLMPGYRCNARCRSCLWGDSHRERTRMRIEDACAWIDQAYALGDLMLVGFSGGEAFIYLQDMIAISRYASSKYGLPSVAATNAFWAKTPEKAEATLRSLYDEGLRQLLVSVDDFHQEWIRLDNVRNCLNAAQVLGIGCTLQCVVTRSSHKLDYYMEALGVAKSKGLDASEIPCTPVGAASTSIPRSEFSLQAEIPSDYCTILQALIVRPEGKVHLCRGPAFDLPALTAGNLREEPLESIIERAEWNPVFNALALGNGPRILADTLGKAGSSDWACNGYASTCHACHQMLKQPDAEALLQKELEPQRPELFVRRTILDQETPDRSADILKI